MLHLADANVVVAQDEEVMTPAQRFGMERSARVRRATMPNYNSGTSPYDVDFATNYDKKLNKNWVTPRFSSLVYKISVSETASVR